jgi:hypothetical protein
LGLPGQMLCKAPASAVWLATSTKGNAAQRLPRQLQNGKL